MRVVIIGAGLIGSAIAWRLAQRGCAVTLVGERSANAASGVAAGMLAPVSEASFTDTGLIELSAAAAESFPGFAAELEAASGLPAGFSATPTLSVAGTADDVGRLRALAEFLVRRGLLESAELLVGRALRRLEPLLAPGVRAGLLVERDLSVDNRLLWAALLAAGRAAGVTEVAERAHAADGGRVVLASGRELRADAVVVAAGAWTPDLELGISVPVRPVKGVTLRLDAGAKAPRLRVTVRAFTAGADVYLVPRASGEVVVGASVEDVGFEPAPRAGAVYELLRDGRSAVPAIAEYALAEAAAGFRPGTPDNLPILGASGIDGLYLATGHYRNGVLLSGITADVMARLIVDGELLDIARPFGLDRLVAPAYVTKGAAC